MKKQIKTYQQFLNENNIPEENKNGDCFKVAYKKFIKMIYYKEDEIKNNIVLVHGIVEGQGNIKGIRYVHAWVEDDTYVYDGTLGDGTFKLPKNIYYAIGNIREDEVFRYSQDLMGEKIKEFETYGPWEKILLDNEY